MKILAWEKMPLKNVWPIIVESTIFNSNRT